MARVGSHPMSLQNRALSALDALPDGVATVNERARIEHLNPAAERLLGISVEAARGRSLEVLWHLFEAPVRRRAIALVSRALTGGAQSPEFRERLFSMGAPMLELTASPVRDAEQTIIGAVIVVRDISEVHAEVRQLRYAATHDPLTGLLNRREFERHLARVLEGGERRGHGAALCYIDLDFFKVVNDTCGHVAGDELLRRLCTVLQHTTRKGDILARIGGDEFGLLLQGCDAKDAVAMAVKFQNTINRFRFFWEGRAFQLGASIGVLPITGACRDIDELLRAADRACYVAKDRGRNRVHVSAPQASDLTSA